MSLITRPTSTIAARRPRTLAPLIVCAVALTSCADGSTFETTQLSGGYRTANFNYVAGGRDFHTVVRGNPFGGDDDADRVTAALNTIIFRQATNFTAQPGPSARLQYRMVLVFNPQRRVTPNTLCRDADTLAVAPPNQQLITVDAAYCNGDKAITSLRGRLRGGADAARFKHFLAQVLQLLFPDRGLGRR